MLNAPTASAKRAPNAYNPSLLLAEPTQQEEAVGVVEQEPESPAGTNGMA